MPILRVSLLRAALPILLIITLWSTATMSDQLSDDVAQLIAVDKKMQRAFVDRDIAALEQIFTDDYRLVLASGAERSKQEVLAEVRSPANKWEINETSQWQVKVFRDTAIVVAMLHQKGISDGQSFDSNVKFSDTYIRENGKWRNLHAHASKAVDVK